MVRPTLSRAAWLTVILIGGTLRPTAAAAADPVEADFPLVPVDRDHAKVLAAGEPVATWAFQPSADPPAKPLSPRGMVLKASADNYDQTTRLLFTAPQSPQLAVVRMVDAPFKPRLYRLERFDLTTGKAMPVVALPPGTKPLAISPTGTFVLCAADPSPTGTHQPNRVDLLSVRGGTAVQVVSWHPAPPAVVSDTVESADFVDDAHVLVRTAFGNAALWALPKGGNPSAVYTVDAGQSEFHMARLLAGRRLVAVSGPNGITFYAALTGDAVGHVGSPDLNNSTFTSASDDGSRIAVATNAGVDLYDGRTGRRITTAHVNAPQAAVECAGHDLYLTRGRSLWDGTKDAAIWDYDRPGNDLSAPPPPVLFAGRLYYGIKPDDRTAGWIASAAVPDRKALAAQAKADPGRAEPLGTTKLTAAGLAN